MPTDIKLAGKEKWKHVIVDVSGVKIGEGQDLVVIAGPCAVESLEQTLETAKAVQKLGAKILRGGAFKPRTSPYSFQGLGEKGLEILAEVSKKLKMPFVTEVIDTRHVELVASCADMLQIGARNMANFELLKEVGKAGKPVLLKRGPSASIDEWLLAAEYIMKEGNNQVVLCERGVRGFEKYTRYTFDVSAIPVVKKGSCLPVIADPSHTSGSAEFVEPLALSAIAAGADGLIVEVHMNPKKAVCDKEQQLTPSQFAELMKKAKNIEKALNK